MLQELALAVFTQTPRLYDKVADSVKTLGVAVTQFAYGERPDSVERWAGASNLIALFDATSEERETCLRWIDRLAKDRPNTVSLWLEREFNQENMVQAVRAGARDVLVGEFTAEDVQSLVKRAADLFLEHRTPATVLGVMGSTGGCGVSTLVANLAVEIAKLKSVSVGVLDLDTCSSGVGLLLNLNPDVTLFDLQGYVEDLDSSLIKRAVAEHPSGVSLIAAQGWPLEHLPIPEKIVRRVMLRMQQLFPYILVDLPRELSSASRMAIEATDALLLLTPYSMMGATGAAHVLQALESLDHPRGQILWVANSVSEPAALTLQQLRRVMSRKPFAKIPFAPAPVNQAAGGGACLAEVAPRAAVTKSIHKLARALCRSFGHSDADNRDSRMPIGQTASLDAALSQAGAL